MLPALARRGAATLALPNRQQWAASAVFGTMMGLYLVAGLSLSGLGGSDARAFIGAVPPSWTGLKMPGLDTAPALPEPFAIRDMPAVDAVAFNNAIPVAKGPNPAARPFSLSTASFVDKTRSLDCLTAAVYYEAGIEAADGQRAVAQVVLNRLRHPAFPKTVCGVVYQGSERRTGCQFTFTCDGALSRRPSVAGWARARAIAEEALAGYVYRPVGYATHYHTNWVVPYWSASLTKVANVGTHIFYRWQGGWGGPAAFRYAYAGSEPDVTGRRARAEDADGAADPLLGPDETLPPAINRAALEMAGRAVMRHYEPLREQAAAATKVELAKAEVPASLRWALTGESTKAAAPASPPAAKTSAIGAPPPPKAVPAPAPVVVISPPAPVTTLPGAVGAK
jgi:hypothetical protein